MLILECSQGCYGRTDGWTDGSITISLHNFVGEKGYQNKKNATPKTEKKSNTDPTKKIW